MVTHEATHEVVASRRSIRVAAAVVALLTLVLAAIAFFDHDTTARLPFLPRAMRTSVLSYTVVAALMWFVSTSNDLTSALTAMRYVLIAVMGAYATSFVPLAVYAVPAVLAVTATVDARSAARALRLPLVGFIAMSLTLGACAVVVAVRSEAALRSRLEGIVMFASVVQAAWHVLAGGVAASLMGPLAAFIAGSTAESSRRLGLAYRRAWFFSAIGLAVVGVLVVVTALFVQLERSSGPPR